MKYKLFAKLYKEAESYSNVDVYITERGYQEWMNKYMLNGDASIVSNILQTIYTLQKQSLVDMRKSFKISRVSFCETYGFLSTTVQKWENGVNKMPEGTRRLIAYTLFMDKIL